MPVTAASPLPGIKEAPVTSAGNFKMMESCSEPSVSVKSASTAILAVLPEPITASSTPSLATTSAELAFGASATGLIVKVLSIFALSAKLLSLSIERAIILISRVPE